jgi:hypothetical protein
MWLAWIKGPKGPEPQLWHVKPHASAGKPVEPLAERLLTEREQSISLDELAMRYPAPAAPVQS